MGAVVVWGFQWATPYATKVNFHRMAGPRGIQGLLDPCGAKVACMTLAMKKYQAMLGLQQGLLHCAWPMRKRTMRRLAGSFSFKPTAQLLRRSYGFELLWKRSSTRTESNKSGAQALYFRRNGAFTEAARRETRKRGRPKRRRGSKGVNQRE